MSRDDLLPQRSAQRLDEGEVPPLELDLSPRERSIDVLVAAGVVLVYGTMIVGVLPLALSTATGAELHRPLAIGYIGGFFFAILLKMIAVPVLYVILSRFDRQPATCVVPE